MREILAAKAYNFPDFFDCSEEITNDMSTEIEELFNLEEAKQLIKFNSEEVKQLIKKKQQEWQEKQLKTT